MPIHKFNCRKCGHTFEVQRRFGSKTSPKCKECNCRSVMKILSPPTVKFLGDGWATTKGFRN